MLLTKKSEYALLSLVSIAKSDSPKNVDVLSRELNIPKSFLAKIMQNLAKQGVGSQVHYIPVVTQPYYQKMDYKIDNYPVTLAYYQKTLSIPLFYGLTDSEQRLVIDSIQNILQ